MARTSTTTAVDKVDVATAHTASFAVTKEIEPSNVTGGAITATLPTAVGIAGKSFTILKTDSSTNAVNVATTSSQTITGTGGTTDAIVSQGAATTYTSDGANWVTSATAGVPFTDPAADKILYWQNSTKAVKPVTIGTNLTLTSGTLNASGGSGITIGTTGITSGASSRLLYETAGNVVGELILGTNLSISGGTTLDAAGGSATDISTRAYDAVGQTLTTGTDSNLTFGTEDYDTDSSHYTSDAALSGLLSTTANNSTVTGNGSTLFLTELSVGQVFFIPGAAAAGARAYCVVTAIASNSSMTVASQTQPVTAVSNVTATRTSAAFVARTAGKYVMSAQAATSPSATSQTVSTALLHNSDGNTATIAQIIAYDNQAAYASAYTVSRCSTTYNLAQWDFVLFRINAVNLGAAPTTDSTIRSQFTWHKIF